MSGRSALKELLELLEEYAPMWCTPKSITSWPPVRWESPPKMRRAPPLLRGTLCQYKAIDTEPASRANPAGAARAASEFRAFSCLKAWRLRIPRMPCERPIG